MIANIAIQPWSSIFSSNNGNSLVHAKDVIVKTEIQSVKPIVLICGGKKKIFRNYNRKSRTRCKRNGRTFVGKFSIRHTWDNGTIPADAMKTTNAKQTTGTQAYSDKSWPFLFRYKNDDRLTKPKETPNKEVIKKVFLPNRSASCVVHKFPKISITAIAIDAKYGSTLVPVRSKIYTLYEMIVKQPLSCEKYANARPTISPFTAFRFAAKCICFALVH